MARLRYNGLTATLGTTLAAADTTIVFSGPLTDASGPVPTLGSGDEIALTILSPTGTPAEIVTLTAYTTGDTTGTITRGQESTTPVGHTPGMRVVHALTVVDVDSKLDTAQKGAASGVAPLDSGSRVPEANLPANLAAASLSATLANPLIQSLVMAGNLPRRAVPSPLVALNKYLGLYDKPIASGGSGYAVNDVIRVNGGPGTVAVPALLTVTAVSGGTITALSRKVRGLYERGTGPSTAVINGMTTTAVTGTGTGATINGDFRMTDPSGIDGSITLVGPTDARFRHTGRNSQNIASTGYYGDNMGNAWRMSYEWATDDPTPEILLIGVDTNVMLYVDGKQISDQNIVTDASGARYILRLNLGSKTTRNYRLVGVNQAFGGVQIASTSTLTAPTRTRPLAVAFGDSYAVGNGAENATSDSLSVMADLLGVDLIIRAQSSTGWTSGGSNLPVTRVTDGLNMDRTPDFIFWDLGYNDQGASMATLTANLNAAVDQAQTLAPAATQIAFGPATPLGPTTELTTVKAAVRDAMLAQGVEFIEQGWVTVKNAVLYTGSDGIHPTATGHKFLGAHKAFAAHSALND